MSGQMQFPMNSSVENKILHAADETFLHLGFQGTTVDKIADTAGVNKAAIHYYFRSKENIYTLVFKNNLILLFDALNTNDFLATHKFKSPLRIKCNENTNIALIAWFIVNEIRVNNQIISGLIKADEKINQLINLIFYDSSNLKILEKLINFQLSEIVNQVLKDNLKHQ